MLPTDSQIKIQNAVPENWQAIVDLLSRAGLPTEDLTVDQISAFLVAKRVSDHDKDAPLLGAIALQRYAECGLLRSLVVDATARGSGVGRSLVTALEVQAKSDGVQALWLLTIDADRFFSGLNYRSRNRPSAPQAIAATREFRDLCPDDAVLMSKEL